MSISDWKHQCRIPVATQQRQKTFSASCWLWFSLYYVK
jgi:hypothetical protein